MNYENVRIALNDAWGSFFESLHKSGFTNAQLDELEDLLDGKDCYNDVQDCVMGANR